MTMPAPASPPDPGARTLADDPPLPPMRPDPSYVARLDTHTPPEMRALAQWVCWKWEHGARNKDTGARQRTKVLYDPRTGRRGNAADARTWAPLADALRTYQRGGYAGLGFVFARTSGVAGVDLDHCRDAATGEIAPWALAIIRRLDSYTEVSPSGTGVHILLCGELPAPVDGAHHIRHKQHVAGAAPDAAQEVYGERRYFTFTADHLAGTPTGIEERGAALTAYHREAFAPPARATRTPTSPPAVQTSAPAPAPAAQTPALMSDLEIIQRAHRARLTGRDFAALWRGDASAQSGDASRADYALLRHLRYWTGGDAGAMDRLFRQSGLMRAKWDERHFGDGATYGQGSIASVLTGPFKVYIPRTDTPPARGASHSDTAGADVDDSQGAEDAPPDDGSQADALLRVAAAAELFKTPDGACHARAWVNGHYETWPIGERGGGFRLWLIQEYRDTHHGHSPNPQAVTQAVEAIRAEATFTGATHDVYVRLAEHAGALYLDIGDSAWRCVEISAAGWRVLDAPPVYFRRPKGMRALPEPVTGGSLDELRPLIAPESDADWILICAWLLGTLHPSGPYPHLSLNGHAGAGKSTKTRILRQLTDPSSAPTRKDPKEDRDLAVAAHNNWILALDNLSYMPAWLSDFLCQLSTGSGSAFRALYTDDEETIFNARRPVIFNGIEEVATRGDLLDRTISVTLSRIADGRRKTEGEIDAAFAASHPRILGALCDAAACALRRRATLRIANLPRMADFALWVVAACPALGWDADHFLAVYAGNREAAISNELDASSVAGALLRFMRQHERASAWTGEASDLYELLTPLAGDAIIHTRAWPASPRALSGALKRLAPALATGEGITVTHWRETSRHSERKNGGRYITIEHRTLTDDAKSSVMTQTHSVMTQNTKRAATDPAWIAPFDVADDAISGLSLIVPSENKSKGTVEGGNTVEGGGNNEDRRDFASSVTSSSSLPTPPRDARQHPPADADYPGWPDESSAPDIDADTWGWLHADAAPSLAPATGKVSGAPSLATPAAEQTRTLYAPDARERPPADAVTAAADDDSEEWEA